MRSPWPSRAANASAARNDFPATLTADQVAVGFWNVETQELCDGPVNLVPTGPDTCSAAPGPTDPPRYPDAVQIDLRSSIPMVFDFSTKNRSVERVGVAVARARTMGKLGSVFSGIQLYDPTADCSARYSTETQMTFMNQLYTEYLGINVSGGVGTSADTGTMPCDVTGPHDGLKLDALSWQGLAFGDVSLRDIAANMGLASPDELAGSSVNARDFLTAAADAMQADGDAANVQAGTILGTIASAMDAGSQFAFDDMGANGSGGAGSGTTCGDPDQPCAGDADFNALELLSLTAMLIDGNNFASVDLPLAIPGTATTVTPRISIIEPPQVDTRWKFAGEYGPHTAQVKIAVDIPLTGVQLDLADLGIPGVSGFTPVNGNIPLLIEVARADAFYQQVACSPEGINGSVVDMLVNTGAVSIGFGAVTDSELQQSGDAAITASSLLTGSVGITLPSIPPLPGATISLDVQSLTNVSERRTYQAGVGYDGGYETNVNLLGASEAHDFTNPYPAGPWRYDGGISGTSVTDDAFAHIDYNAASSGTLTALNAFGVGQAQIENMVSNAILTVVDQLGQDFVDQLLTTLGITVAGADGWVQNVQCQVPAIANRG